MSNMPPTLPGNQFGPPPVAPPPAKNTLGTVAMVLGIIAAVMAIIPGLSYAAWLFAIPAAIVGFIGLRKHGLPRGRALAGLIEGAAAFVVAIVVSIASSGGASQSFEDGVKDAQAAATQAPAAATSAATPEAASPSQTPAAAPQPAANTSPYGTYPSDEAAFIQTVKDTANSLGGDMTDLQRSQAVKGRDASLCTTLGDATASDWTGKVTSIGANGDGKAYVKVEIAPSITIMTWNNAFSDVLDNTLIDPSSPAFANLVAMKEGQTVRFTAQMVPDDGSCLKKANLTDTFYGISPEFIAHFSAVTAI